MKIHWKIVLNVSEQGLETFRPYIKAGKYTGWMWSRLGGRHYYDCIDYPIIHKQEDAMKRIEEAIQDIITRLKADRTRKAKGGIVAQGVRVITEEDLK